MPENFLQRLLQRAKGSGSAPLKLNLEVPTPPPPPRKPPAKTPEPYPGNYVMFDFWIEVKIGDIIHIGYPKVPTRESPTAVVRWGTVAKVMPKVPWVDIPGRGFAGRTLTEVQDALGAEGMITDKLLRFEKIIDLTPNVVIYSLFCPAENFRMIYGFNRTVFEPGYVHPQRAEMLGRVAAKTGDTPAN